jgi:hypothetical protein
MLRRRSEELENKAPQMQFHVQNNLSSLEQETRSRIERSAEAKDADVESGDAFFDEAVTEKLKSAGADVATFEMLMASLTQDQFLFLFALEAQRRESGTESTSSVFEEIAGLTEEQIAGLTELESLLSQDEIDDDPTV